jgi:hypothetical protein
MNNLEAQAAFDLILGSTNVPVDRARTSIALSWAREHGLLDVARHMAMAKRAEHLRWITVTQRRWQASVSRRPARGRHHDSWSIRERYVRCN